MQTSRYSISARLWKYMGNSHFSKAWKDSIGDGKWTGAHNE